MPHFNEDIVRRTRENTNFRTELVTGALSQLVVMNIDAGSEIGEEVHDDVDQTLVIVDGEGEAIMGGETSPVGPSSLVFVPAGTRHNFRNTGSHPLKLYTIYAPPEHPAGTVHVTKEEADAAEHDH